MAIRYAVLAALLAGCAGLNLRLPKTCSGGAKLVDNECYCAAGQTWNGLACQGTPQANNCGGNSFSFGPTGKAQCFCLDGYRLDGNQCVQLQCSGGSFASGDQCVCPNNTQWNGAACAEITCSGGAVVANNQCVCPDGTQWTGSECAAPAPPPAPPPEPAPAPVPEPAPAPGVTCNGGAVAYGDHCVCPEGTAWDGSACAAQVRRTCRQTLLDKNYGPSSFASCDGVNQRCAIALLDKNYGPSSLASCKGVDPTCAEALLAHNYGPSSLSSCAGIDGRCAVAVLDKGYGPSSLSNCRRR